MTSSETQPAFPAGLRVMVVDDDPCCLKVVEKMLIKCSYKVTTCSCSQEALTTLRDQRQDYDIVLSDVYMPDMDGFKLLECIGLELDLPVIMMSGNAETEVVLRGITHGAVDYLLKPVRIEELRNIWQHVIRKKKDGPSSKVAGNEDSEAGGDAEEETDASPEEGTKKKRKPRDDEDGDDDEGDDEDGEEDSAMPKKPRVVWSVELHQQFVNAVNQLGIDKAVPKRILDLMNVSGLTRENVASHLQKYRLYLKRLLKVQQQQQASQSAAQGYPMEVGQPMRDMGGPFQMNPGGGMPQGFMGGPGMGQAGQGPMSFGGATGNVNVPMGLNNAAMFPGNLSNNAPNNLASQYSNNGFQGMQGNMMQGQQQMNNPGMNDVGMGNMRFGGNSQEFGAGRGNMFGGSGMTDGNSNSGGGMSGLGGGMEGLGVDMSMLGTGVQGLAAGASPGQGLPGGTNAMNTFNNLEPQAQMQGLNMQGGNMQGGNMQGGNMQGGNMGDYPFDGMWSSLSDQYLAREQLQQGGSGAGGGM